MLHYFMAIKNQTKNKQTSFDEIYEHIISDAQTADGSNKVILSDKVLMKKISCYVTNLITGIAPLDEVMCSSYVHKNGFQKIVLGRMGGFALRFHRYIPGIGDKNIHDHRWSRMDSFVLEGNLLADYLFHTNHKVKSAEKFQHHTYSKVGDDYIVEHKGESYLLVGKHVEHLTGCLYSMKSKELHRILPSNQSVATLVVTHPVPENRVWCNLYQKYIIEELEPVREERLSQEQMITSLKHLNALLLAHLTEEASVETTVGEWQ